MNERGFTLLEVMIAMAIMVVAFTAILTVQSNSLQSSLRARDMNTVSMLLKEQLVQTEAMIEGRSFGEIRKEEAGQFKEPYQDYSWSREVKEVNFPNIASLAGGAAGGGANGGDSSEGQAPQTSGTTAGGAAGNVVDQMGTLVTKFLSKSIREVTVTVKWKRGTGTRKSAVSFYWVDLNSGFDLTP